MNMLTCCYIKLGAILVAAWAWLPGCSAPGRTVSSAHEEGAALYKQFCAGCHGRKLQGGTASSLLKEPLAFGSERKALENVIKNGIPGTQMIPWSGAFTEKQLAAVVDFILAVREDTNLADRSAAPQTLSTEVYTLSIERLITEGMDTPWGIEFIDTDHALITGNKGVLYQMKKGKLEDQPIAGLPEIYGADMFGGLMDLAVDPDYRQNGWIYLAFSHNPARSKDRNTPGMTKVVRGKVENNQWVQEETLFEVPDSLRVSGGMRWGSRFLFDRAGFLYFTIGDMQQAIQSGQDPQLPTRPQGKIYRIYPDGRIPADNPFYGQEDKLQAIYAWGTRNVQGLAQHPETGEIFFSDHGPQGGDELNQLKNGGNYGWPLVTFGVNYDGSPITRDTALVGTEQPLTYWTPSIAVCAIAFADSPLFPKWQNSLLVTALKFQELRRLVLDGNRVVQQEVLMKGEGRVRDVKIGPDGALYVLTNQPDALLRLTPQN